MRMKSKEETLNNDIDKLMVSEFNPYISIPKDYSKNFPVNFQITYTEWVYIRIWTD